MKMNSDSFFEKHFAGADILSDSRAIDGSDLRPSFFSDSHGGQGEAVKPAPKNIEVLLECTLEELYNGSMKQVEYERSIVKHDAKTVLMQRCIEQIEVKPGFSNESVLCFKGKGHEQAGHSPADLVVKFKQLDHAAYKRIGDDLVLTKKVSLEDAIEMKPVTIQTLDGRLLQIALDE